MKQIQITKPNDLINLLSYEFTFTELEQIVKYIHITSKFGCCYANIFTNHNRRTGSMNLQVSKDTNKFKLNIYSRGKEYIIEGNYKEFCKLTSIIYKAIEKRVKERIFEKNYKAINKYAKLVFA